MELGAAEDGTGVKILLLESCLPEILGNQGSGGLNFMSRGSAAARPCLFLQVESFLASFCAVCPFLSQTQRW